MIQITCFQNTAENLETMNRIFKKSRSVSPSFEIPKICLPRQSECIDDGYDLEVSKLLKVPNESRGRSSSFDSSSLRQDFTKELLNVPTKQGRRCHSFDSACTLQMSPATSEESISDTSPSNWSLRVPQYKGRRSSLDIPKLCIHCMHMEAKAQESIDREEAMKVYQPVTFGDEDSDGYSFTSSTSYTSTTQDSLSDPSGFYYLNDSEDEGNESDCEDSFDSPDCKVTHTTTPCENFQNVFHSNSSSISPEKRSILDFLNGHNLPHIDSKDEEDLDDLVDELSDDEDENDDDEDYINAVTLTVPNIKQQRSSSMDACFMKDLKTASGSKQVQRQKSFDNGDMLDVPLQIRSSSVDVNLPTEQESCYVAIPHSDSR